MEFIGIDVHKRESQVCVLGEGGEVVLEQRLATQRGRLAELLGKRPKARILLEASTESEWVARCLEELGHEVVVADPNFASMYATRSRRVKTDKRDARTPSLLRHRLRGPLRKQHFEHWRCRRSSPRPRSQSQVPAPPPQLLERDTLLLSEACRVQPALLPTPYPLLPLLSCRSCHPLPVA
jgi:hypothetical protein